MIKAIPIRYMVISSLYGMSYLVIDTSYAGQGRTICKTKNADDAQKICSAMNAIYGHPQGSEYEVHE